METLIGRTDTQTTPSALAQPEFEAESTVAVMGPQQMDELHHQL